MKYFLRPYRCFGVAVLLGLSMAMMPPGAKAQTSEIAHILKSPKLLLHSSTPGYLGVLVGDVDQDAATRLKLKDAKGAVVTLIDHDAPAAQAGIRVNDVLLELNGQTVNNAEQFGRILKDLPPGRTVSIVLSRDGNVQTIAVQLVDRKKMEHDVWNKIDDGGDEFAPVPSMGMLSGGSGSGGADVPSAGGFHLPWFGSSLNVGALVEPLTQQMADYLGVESGLMVKQVARKSEAAASGMKAFDVILKVGTEAIATVSDWDRALRSNRGKTVQVTILRNRKQQTLTLQVDSKHKRGEMGDLFPDANCPMMAMLDPEMAQDLANEMAAQAQQMQQQSDALREQLEQMPMLSQEEAEAMQRQAEQLRKNMESLQLQMNRQQMDQMHKQMNEFRKQSRPEDFQMSPQQKEELRRQMDQLKRQMEQLQAHGLGQFV